LQSQVVRSRNELDECEHIFVERPNFAEQAREYTVLQRVHGEQKSQLLSRLESAQTDADVCRREVPAQAVMALGLLGLALVFFSLGLYLGNWNLFVPSVLSIATFGFFLVQFLKGRRDLAQALWEVEEAHRELDVLDEAFAARSAPLWCR
jgi:hypothetical protein